MNPTSTHCLHCEPSSLWTCPGRDVLTSSSCFLISAESPVARSAFVWLFFPVFDQKMKAVSPVHPQDSSHHSLLSGGGGASHPSAVHSLSKHSVNISRCRMDEEDLLCLQYDMNDCYTRLKRLVPTIPQDKKVSKVEILQHVIDYILDLQLALETHPSLQKTQTCPPPHTSNPNRTPLTVLNVDHHQRTSIVKKPEDSILCR